MTPDQIDRVFGRGRLQMVTGAHVEVFREAAAPGESRRYTKRFLTTAEGDYAQWTEREWRILARLIGHGTRCVPDVVQFDRGARGTQARADLRCRRDRRSMGDAAAGRARRPRVRATCSRTARIGGRSPITAWSRSTRSIRSQLVHLDVKGDNICIPIGPRASTPPCRDSACSRCSASSR